MSFMSALTVWRLSDLALDRQEPGFSITCVLIESSGRDTGWRNCAIDGCEVNNIAMVSRISFIL